MEVATLLVGVFLCLAILAAAGQVKRAIYALNETLISLWRIREELEGIRSAQWKIDGTLEKDFWGREAARELEEIKKLLAKSQEVKPVPLPREN
jgi:transcription initiation factor IIE alpha subunit